MRITIYFVLFGILVGYASFILYTIGAAQNNIEMAYQTIVPVFKEITGSRGEDFIAELINKKNDELVRLYDIISRSTYSSYGKVIPRIFFYSRSAKEWKKIYIDSGNIFREAPVAVGSIPILDKTITMQFQHSSSIFFGQSDRVSLFVHLPLSRAKNRYVLSLEMDREGIVTFIKNNVHRIVVFGSLVLIISIVLGKLFSYRIARPIMELSDVAKDRAAGNMSREFTVNRRDEIGILSDSLNSMSHKIDAHVREIERRIKTMETMNRIDKAVLSSISRTDLLHRVIGLVSSLFHSDATAMALFDQERNGFELLSRYDETSQGILAEKPFIPVKNLDSDLINKVRHVFLFSKDGVDRDYRELFEKMAGRTIGTGINVPVCLADEYLGSLVLTRDSGEAFAKEEVESIIMLADQVGIALQSIRSFEEKEQLLLGILLALTRSIDAKSKWTAGHSERVAAYSEKIAFKMRMNEEETRTIAFSAILHDIGKIAVSEMILDKPGRLTEEEFSIIKEHPKTGARIISDIPSYARILPGILYHHEHWDGSGYPEGLRGDAIPVSSRIITVADVWDAISADRPYRKGLRRNEAIAFMKDKCGALFDGDIVRVFLEIIHEEK